MRQVSLSAAWRLLAPQPGMIPLMECTMHHTCDRAHPPPHPPTHPPAAAARRAMFTWLTSRPVIRHAQAPSSAVSRRPGTPWPLQAPPRVPRSVLPEAPLQTGMARGKPRRPLATLSMHRGIATYSQKNAPCRCCRPAHSLAPPASPKCLPANAPGLALLTGRCWQRPASKSR